jgi:hypothetical protein
VRGDRQAAEDMAAIGVVNLCDWLSMGSFKGRKYAAATMVRLGESCLENNV